MGWDLKIRPRTLESQFWQSELVLNFLLRFDGIMLFTSALTNILTISVVGEVRGMPWWFPRAGILGLVLAACIQRLFLYKRPIVYKKHRFAIALANRLVRSVSLYLLGVYLKNIAWEVQDLAFPPSSTPKNSIQACSKAIMIPSGAGYYPVHAINFPVDLRTTIALHLMGLYTGLAYGAPLALQLLVRPDVMRGDVSLCMLLERSSMLFVPNQLDRDSQLRLCEEQRSAVVFFTVFFVSFALPVTFAFLVERNFKVMFLEQCGFSGLYQRLSLLESLVLIVGVFVLSWRLAVEFGPGASSWLAVHDFSGFFDAVD